MAEPLNDQVGLVDSAVTYDGLPISSGGAHGLGRMPMLRAHQAFKDFLANCGHEVALTYRFDYNVGVGVLPVPEFENELRDRSRGGTAKTVMLYRTARLRKPSRSLTA